MWDIGSRRDEGFVVAIRQAMLAGALAAIAALPAWSAELDPARTHAVLIGVLEWENGLPGFPKEHRKDQELRDVLVTRGVPAGQITLLLDAEATLANVHAAIEQAVAKADRDSTLIIYYAGHGWPAGDGDYCLANYDVSIDAGAQGWSLQELGATLSREFRGKRVILWADCCYSGGLQVVVDALAERRIAAFSLTSAGTANTSTRNWTFTQSIIDGLRGEPLVDANGDGRVTLVELRNEVHEAMKHREGQEAGYRANGIEQDFLLSKAAGRRPKDANPSLPVGSYVRVLHHGTHRYGRVVGHNRRHVVVQFYDYAQKNLATFAAGDVSPSTRRALAVSVLDAGVRPDCLVEWREVWFPAKLLQRTPNGDRPQFRVHYLGYDSSWDEWVEGDRIRFLKPKRPQPSSGESP